MLKDYYIISNICTAGFCYRYSDCQLMSPFVWIGILHNDFLKLMKNPFEYIYSSIRFKDNIHIKYNAYNTIRDYEYPTFTLNDIVVHKPHNSIEESHNLIDKWDERVARGKNLEPVIIFNITNDYRQNGEYDLVSLDSLYKSNDFVETIINCPIEKKIIICPTKDCYEYLSTKLDQKYLLYPGGNHFKIGNNGFLIWCHGDKVDLDKLLVDKIDKKIKSFN